MILPVRPHFIFDMLPKEQRQDFIIPVPCRESGSPSMLEWALLIACGRIAGCTVDFGTFEIGTYKGQTSAMLEKNLPGPARTLDLDISQSSPVLDFTRVERLRGHSMAFDFAPWRRSSRLVFIDGAHDVTTVRSDTDNAFDLLTYPDSDPGAIVWHDYSPLWPGVQQALRDIFGGDTQTTLDIYHIEDTSLCVYLRGTK